jgi:hypothetical protein
MEPEGSIPCSQQPATFPYPQLDQSSPWLPILFLKIHLNITIPSTPMSSPKPMRITTLLQWFHLQPQTYISVISYKLELHFFQSSK